MDIFSHLFNEVLNAFESAVSIDPAIKQQILNKSAKGDSTFQIAQDLNISTRTVRRVKQHGTTLTPVEQNRENRLRNVAKLSNLGYSIEQIAQKLNAGYRTIVGDRQEINQNPKKYGVKKILPYSYQPPTGDTSAIDLNKPKTTSDDYWSDVTRDKRHIGSFKSYYNKNLAKKEEDNQYTAIGKLHDRGEYLKVISPIIKGMGKDITVLSLPHNYLFEMDLLKHFNLNQIISYGFNLDNLKARSNQRVFALTVAAKSNGKIKPRMLFANANTALLRPSWMQFKRLVPHGKFGGGFIEFAPLPPDGFDIIDLDFCKYPGTLGSMRPNANMNPWFAPIVAAKNYLKPGGLVMVTYSADDHRSEERFMHMFKSKENNMAQYNRSLPSNNKFYINPYHPSNTIKSGFNKKWGIKTDEKLKEQYPIAAMSANIYTQNILDYAIEKDVNLKPIWINVYPGKTGFVMYRAIFQKV